MRAVLIGFVMVVASLAIITTLGTVLQSHAERAHPVEAGFNPREASVVPAKNTSSFFQRMVKRIFHDHDAPASEDEN